MQRIETAARATGAERKRVESVVETLATLHSEGETLAEIAHDARNMVTALGLYCDLLEPPGVLAPAFAHYAGELRLVAAASRRLVEKLVALDNPAATQPSFWRNQDPAAEQWAARPSSAAAGGKNLSWESMTSAPVANLAAELLATRNLLAALAGPSVTLTMDVEGGALPARISGEDLTRVLVNLLKNAVEAMPSGGRVEIKLREQAPREQSGHDSNRSPEDRQEDNGRGINGKGPRWLALVIEDNGPGIPGEALEKIFASGYTSRPSAAGEAGTHAGGHRGLGLAISRALVAAAGGRMYAENRALGGARIVIELPAESS